MNQELSLYQETGIRAKVSLHLAGPKHKISGVVLQLLACVPGTEKENIEKRKKLDTLKKQITNNSNEIQKGFSYLSSSFLIFPDS